MNRIEELNQSLKDAWASDQKVKALKIVIQVRSSDFFLFLLSFLCKTPLWIIRIFIGLVFSSGPFSHTSCEFVFMRWLIPLPPCAAVQVVHCTVQETHPRTSLWVVQLHWLCQCAVHWPLYSYWSFYNLYRQEVNN